MSSPTGSTDQDRVYTTLRQWLTVGRFLPGSMRCYKLAKPIFGPQQIQSSAKLGRLCCKFKPGGA